MAMTAGSGRRSPRKTDAGVGVDQRPSEASSIIERTSSTSASHPAGRFWKNAVALIEALTRNLLIDPRNAPATGLRDHKDVVGHLDINGAMVGHKRRSPVRLPTRI